MNESFINSYYDLDLKDKRKYFGKELSNIGKLLEQIEYKLGLDNVVDIGKYESEKKQFSEEEMLVYFYQDIFNIERELRLIDAIVNEDIEK